MPFFHLERKSRLHGVHLARPAARKVPEKAADEFAEGGEFGEPPAIFVAQYGRVIDTRYKRSCNRQYLKV